MQSIIVEVYVPATSVSFDFRLPSTGKIGDIVKEMIRILESTQNNLMFDQEQPMLCDCERGIILQSKDSVAEAGLQDGSKLLLA